MDENNLVPLGPFPAEGSFDKIVQWYEKQPWLRAVVQAVPYAGGPADTLLAWRGVHVNQKRVMELFRHVNDRVSALEGSKLSHEFLGSGEFFEILRSCVEAAARAADTEKRKKVANYLAGTIERGTITDLSQQIAEDLKLLQPLHLKIIEALPNQSEVEVHRDFPPAPISGMDLAFYQKGLADLERLGYIRFHRSGGTINAGGGHWATTKYLVIFKREVLGHG